MRWREVLNKEEILILMSKNVGLRDERVNSIRQMEADRRIWQSFVRDGVPTVLLGSVPSIIE